MSFSYMTEFLTPFLNYIAKLQETTRSDKALNSDPNLKPELIDLKDLILANCQSLPEITQNILESKVDGVSYRKFSTEFGSVAEVSLHGVRTIISNDPIFAAHVFKEKVFIQRLANDDGLTHLGMKNQGIAWNNDNVSWRQIRKVFQTSLKEKDLKCAREIASREVMTLVNEQLSNLNCACLNFLEIFRRVSFRVTLELFCDITHGDVVQSEISEDEVIASVASYFKALEYFLFRPNSNLDPDLFKEHQVSVEKLHLYVENLIACGIKKQNQNESSKCEKNLFEKLLELDLGREMLRQCVAELLLAGTDTSSLTLYYCILGLSGKDSLCADFLRSLHCLADDSDAEFDHLVDQLAMETLRFKTVSPLIIRQANADVTINLPDLGPAISIKKHDGVIINIESMNRLPGIWKKPNLFIPGREDLEDNKGKFFPFGEGAKSCVGKYLGLSIVRAVLKTMISKYNFEIVGDVTLQTLETHWDIANQPNETPLIKCTARHVSENFC